MVGVYLGVVLEWCHSSRLYYIPDVVTASDRTLTSDMLVRAGAAKNVKFKTIWSLITDG